MVAFELAVAHNCQVIVHESQALHREIKPQRVEQFCARRRIIGEPNEHLR